MERVGVKNDMTAKINKKTAHMGGFKVKTRQKKLLRIGKTDVRYALGFYWFDNNKIYVAATKADVEEWKTHGYTDEDLHPMEELEDAYRNSSAFKFISWCKCGSIVRQGARQVTFDYTTHKVVLRIR